MCLIIFACQQHPDYPLIIVANRDEFYSRPSLTGHFWKDAPGLFAGKDLLAGGTWMGVTRRGRFAAVTNYRETPSAIATPLVSRGQLCTNFLNSSISAQNYLANLANDGHQYAGFNLIIGEAGKLHHLSNRHQGITPISAGVHGVSNGPLNSRWPKVQQGKAMLQQQLEISAGLEDLLGLMLDTETAADQQLPSTGISIEQEKLLSSRFIQSEHYGTRTTTVMRMDNRGNIDWLEQQFDAEGPISKASIYQLKPD